MFDLDGTLWDTCDACAVAWNNVVARHGMSFRNITADDVRRVAGKSHDECVREVCVGLSEQQLKTLCEESAKEDNRVIAERGGVLYPGAHDALTALAARYPLFIVSNCQAGYIETFMAHTGLGRLFRDFECWGNTGATKAENFKAVVARNGLQAPLFVGDTEGDQSAAAANRAAFVFAAYGFGRCPQAPLHIESLKQLADLILSAP